MGCPLLKIFLFQLLILPCFAGVVINEISPWGRDAEWVEIHNTGNEEVNLSGWIIETQTSIRDVDFPEGAFLPAGGFLVVGDNGTGGGFETPITITDSAIFLVLRNNVGEEINRVDLRGLDFERKDGQSLQRISPDSQLSSSPENWILSSNTKGEENFPPGALVEASEIFLPGEVFANETSSIVVTVSNKGMSEGRSRKLSFKDSSGFEAESIFDIGPVSLKNLSFAWTPSSQGTYSLYASIGSSEINRTALVLKKPEKLAKLRINLAGNLSTGVEYKNLFALEMENKKALEGSCAEPDTVTVAYSVFGPDGSIHLSESFTVEIGCTKTADTGSWTPEEPGIHTLCGHITGSTSGFDAKNVCGNFSVTGTKKQAENLSVSVEQSSMIGSAKSSASNSTPEGKEESLEDDGEKTSSGLLEDDLETSDESEGTLEEDGLEEEGEGTQAVSKPILVQIIDMASEVMVGSEFESTILIENNGDTSVSAKVYSYAYSGKNCITGSWTKNRQDLLLESGESKEILLVNHVEEGTVPGTYLFRARVKVEEKDYDAEGEITVTEHSAPEEENLLLAGEARLEEADLQPVLDIWNDTKIRINLTNCDGCSMVISGPAGLRSETEKKYRVFDAKGSYNVLVLKGGSVVLNESYYFGDTSFENEGGGSNETNLSSNTTYRQEVSTGNFAKQENKRGLFGWLKSTIGGIVSAIINAMASSISA
ncbi:MAG: lamin tail domain-containing protein [Candidatus Aenigmarchaeota archaeon]|nr:lamin tail domain-containing protein [Candidatus Aenigmarchaeota archaeon]